MVKQQVQWWIHSFRTLKNCSKLNTRNFSLPLIQQQCTTSLVIKSWESSKLGTVSCQRFTGSTSLQKDDFKMPFSLLTETSIPSPMQLSAASMQSRTVSPLCLGACSLRPNHVQDRSGNAVRQPRCEWLKIGTGMEWEAWRLNYI